MSSKPESGGLSEDDALAFKKIIENIPRITARDPHWNFWTRVHRHWKAIAVGASAVLAVAGGIIADNETQPEVPLDAYSEAKQRALKDFRVLEALGVCDLELRAEASLEAYRVSQKIGLTTGLTYAELQNGASVARNYGVSCSPQSETNPASRKVNLSEDSVVTLFPGSLVGIDVSDACGIIKNPERMVAPDSADVPTDISAYRQQVQQVATSLADQAGKSC